MRRATKGMENETIKHGQSPAIAFELKSLPDIKSTSIFRQKAFYIINNLAMCIFSDCVLGYVIVYSECCCFLFKTAIDAILFFFLFIVFIFWQSEKQVSSFRKFFCSFAQFRSRSNRTWRDKISIFERFNKIDKSTQTWEFRNFYYILCNNKSYKYRKIFQLI